MANIDVKLKFGLKIGDTLQYDAQLREYTTDDLFAAEDLVGGDKPIKFGAALLCRQLVKVGTFEGPFTLALIGRLKPADFNLLRKAQAELETSGNA